MDKGNCVVKFEFHYQMCEFLAHSKELIISFVKYQISAFKFSLHHLRNRQSITSETTDCLLIPLRQFLNTLVHFSSRFWPHFIMLTFTLFVSLLLVD